MKHSLDKHGIGGPEIARGQRPITADDFAKLPAIVRAGQYSAAKQRPFGPRRVVIKAEVDGERFTYVAEVRRGKRRLDMVSMWKG